MVHVSKAAIKCPSATCSFAYFASSPDPAATLRNHFNNFRVRDAEHDSFFKKPYCVFCGDVIPSKTRKGLWKSGMNKHWLLNHSAEFAEAVDHQAEEEMKIIVILSASQLERLTNEWQIEYDLQEGDVIIRTGKTVRLRRNLVIANNISQKDTLPSLKRQRTTYEKIQATKHSSPTEPGLKHPIISGSASTSQQHVTTKESLGEELRSPGVGPSELVGKYACGEAYRIGGEKQQEPAMLQFGTSADSSQDAMPLMESGSADAFEAMTYCFPGFEDDTTEYLSGGA